MTQLLQKRFDELSEQMEALLASKSLKYDTFLEKNIEEIDSNALLEWQVKARNLLSKACGDES